MEHADLPRFAPNALIEFDWAGKWLTGEEYAHVLHNIDLYCSHYDLGRYGTRQHPNTIYEAPYNGLVYFIEGSSVGSEFGFPACFLGLPRVLFARRAGGSGAPSEGSP